jgi:hypothetical protein
MAYNPRKEELDMKSVQKWVAVFGIAVASCLGSLLFSVMIHPEAMARERKEFQAAPKWQISAIPQGDNRFLVFMMNPETGDIYQHDSNGGVWAKISAPSK